MFDFHTHILPKLDDGSANVEESLAMLRALKEQGVTGVAATPHFYADRSAPEAFFEHRWAAWEALRPHLDPDLPEIRLGAEVRYFEGINRYDGLDRFCMDGTNLLLLEMPHGSWTSRMVEALEDISRRGDVILLLAHVERYWREQKSPVWDRLLRRGILMQVSAEVFIRRRTRKTAINLLQEGRVHLLGTDCHNSTDRSPNMAAAAAVIEQKKGEELLKKLSLREGMLLQKDAFSMKEQNISAGLGSV